MTALYLNHLPSLIRGKEQELEKKENSVKENDSEKDCFVQPEGYILYYYLIKIIQRSNN